MPRTRTENKKRRDPKKAELIQLLGSKGVEPAHVPYYVNHKFPVDNRSLAFITYDDIFNQHGVYYQDYVVGLVEAQMEWYENATKMRDLKYYNKIAVRIAPDLVKLYTEYVVDKKDAPPTKIEIITPSSEDLELQIEDEDGDDTET